MFARFENGVTKFSPQRQKTPKFWLFRNSSFEFEFEFWFSMPMPMAMGMGNFLFFGRGKPFFGGRSKLQNWLASDHPRAYTCMPQPLFLFGAKDVC